MWDHHTGYIEALVGGRQWSPVLNEFDRMRQSCRQPGSAWKPIVYGAALAADAITPGTALRDAPISEYDDSGDEAMHWKSEIRQQVPRRGARRRRVRRLAQRARDRRVRSHRRRRDHPVREEARHHDGDRAAAADGARRVVREAARARARVRRDRARRLGDRAAIRGARRRRELEPGSSDDAYRDAVRRARRCPTIRGSIGARRTLRSDRSRSPATRRISYVNADGGPPRRWR